MHIDKIKALRADGWTDYGICAELNFDGVPCPHGIKWTPSNLDSVKVSTKNPSAEAPKEKALPESGLYVDSDGFYFYKIGDIEGARFRTKAGAASALARKIDSIGAAERGPEKSPPGKKHKSMTVSTGVTLTPSGKYKAIIARGGKVTNLGTFATADEAIKARTDAAKAHPPGKREAPLGGSGIRGIDVRQTGFGVRVRLKGGRRKYIGIFPTLDEAKAALEAAEKSNP